MGIAALFHFSLSDNYPGKLANAVDFNIKMFHQKVGSNLVIQDILKHGSMSASKSFTVLRERLERADEAWTKAGHDQTGLSILLSYSCTHAKCTEVKNTPTCTNLNSNLPSNSLMKLVLRRTDAAEGEWILDCRQFLKVELPVKDEGVPGARTAAGSGDRRTSAQKRQAPSEENVGSGNAVEFDVDAVQAAAPVYKDEEDEPETDAASAAKDDVCTNTLFNHETKDFYNKFQSLEKVIEIKNREMISAVKTIIEQIGSVEKEGEIYIHAVESDDPALVKGAAGTGCNIGANFNYKRRHFDIQILNSLIFFVMALFCVKFVVNILSIFSINI